MPLTITDPVHEGSDIAIRFTIREPGGDAVATEDIVSAVWSLTNSSEEIIDGIQDSALDLANPLVVPISASSNTIAGAADSEKRFVTVKVTFNSGVLGAGIVFNDHVEYIIKKVHDVS